LSYNRSLLIALDVDKKALCQRTTNERLYFPAKETFEKAETICNNLGVDYIKLYFIIFPWGEIS
jgi:hypothetical protein